MIKNLRNKKVISTQERYLKNEFSKAIGLMFSKKKTDFCLVFEYSKPRKIQLHMWFVFYPIDVVFLDNEQKVRERKEDFQPFTCYAAQKEARYFLELPAGAIRQKGIRIGDTIQLSGK
ncbi:MAG: DUF192 domain-containing protein [Nanoarchaeota archaeon]